MGTILSSTVGATAVIAGWAEDALRDPGAVVRGVVGTATNLVGTGWPLLVLAGAALSAARYGWVRRCRARWAAEARVVTVLAPPSVDAAGGAAVWSNLLGLLRPSWRRWLSGQPHLAWEYAFSEAGTALRLWVPGVIPPGLVERAVEAAWPSARTSTEPAGVPFPEPDRGQQRVVVAGQLRLGRAEALPIRTNFEADPTRGLLGAPVGLQTGEYACVQVLARPVAGTRAARARRAARRLHTGRSFSLAGQVLDLLTPHSSNRRRTATASRTPAHDPQTSLATSALNRAIVAKQQGGQYETRVRYTVATDLPADADADQLRAARKAARGRAHALAAAFAVFTDHNHYTRRRLYRPTRRVDQRRLGRGDLLSVNELAALAHLPHDDNLPGLHRAGSKALAPPPGVAIPGPGVKPLGDADTGQGRPVGLRMSDARHHLHVLGATGSGKSTLLAHLLLDDAEAGRGLVLIDPKGDLATDLLTRLPRKAASRLVLFDADSSRRPPCLNPLDGDDTDLTVDNLVSVFRRVYAAFWGPRTDDVMRAACLTLRAQTGLATLADLPKLLTEPAFRARVLARIHDPVLRGFWAWYDDLTDSARSQVIAPLMNKLRAFLLRPFVRDALAAGSSTVDMPAVLNEGGICLVRIPKGSLGEETTRLVGSLVVAQAWQATTGRAQRPQHERPDASLVIDEAHNFLNLPYPIEDMLAEARGFRLSMTLAHQHLGQLPRDLREGISTNARSKIYFAAGPDDARDLARHTHPHLSEHDLTHLGAYHAAARLVTNGEHARPFTLTTRALPDAIPGRARHLRAAQSIQDR
ncbi:type IV secretory system conjugative DNA transfer family protein [Saccharopolyspora sp. HNM0986]|uniref:type IV secretory system conjugative DNA transfer family protein n=1 Tax=Saccharopolyspora galaxeae TaxID=2781241 RepID=UPI00190A6E35|nr:DUF87 domain-containing protein [Saccharopolyspora sp. HNM0986]MBK0870226.1 type IV secretory system conjugative DNA transfer family protein [Saccharopolyspora sp. HNM0986]